MNKVRWMMALLAVGLPLVLAGAARAERVPMTRTSGARSQGARPSIFVPYVTNGNSAFGVAQGVAPIIYKSPSVQDATNPGARPVFNLPFYGATMSFGSASNGAVSAPKPIQSMGGR
jgi:hypothetical protein